MRLSFPLPLPLALLAAAPPTAAQTPAVHDRWHLGAGADALRFGHVVVSRAEPGAAAELRPSSRLAFHLGVRRSVGPWGVFGEAGLAAGHIEARNEVIAISDLTADVSRYRLALGVSRRVIAVGTGELGAELAPTLDLWSVDGESRVRAGAEGRLVLRVPFGAWEVENRLGIGLSGSPIEAADVGDVAEERDLRTVMIGVGLRTGL
jgi:hypothetical protein